MRVAVYNQMFGMDGRGFFSNILAHWAVHFQNNAEKALGRANIDSTIEIIKKSRADIIGICEILEGQERELERGLKKMGFKSVFFVEGHRTKHSNLAIKVAIASKHNCILKKLKGFPTKNEIGGGGGVAHCYFPKQKINLIHIHFAITRQKELMKRQILFFEKYFNKLNGRIILLGDFNQPYPELLKNIPIISKLDLVSNRMKTCSLTPIMKVFHWKDDDHILVKGFEKIKSGFLEGYSDHRLIYADLK